MYVVALSVACVDCDALFVANDVTAAVYRAQISRYICHLYVRVFVICLIRGQSN